MSLTITPESGAGPSQMPFTTTETTFILVRRGHRFVSLLATDITNYGFTPVPNAANKALDRHHPGRCSFRNEINKTSASKDFRVRDVALATNALHQTITRKKGGNGLLILLMREVKQMDNGSWRPTINSTPYPKKPNTLFLQGFYCHFL